MVTQNLTQSVKLLGKKQQGRKNLRNKARKSRSKGTDTPKMSANAQDVTPDSLLVERFKEGDESGFEELVSRYRERIYARVYNMLKNRQDAEEVTQDAFIRAHRGLDKFRGEASFSTWLFQIATNLAHNKYWYWWRRKRSQSMSLDMSITDDGDGTLVDILPSDEATPGEHASTQELVKRVAECIPLLNEKHREILTLRLDKHMSYEEIADELQINVGTVKSRIARARESLKEMLAKELNHE